MPYHGVMRFGSMNGLGWIAMTVLLQAMSLKVSARPLTPTGRSMAVVSAATATNSIPREHWHTIVVSPAPDVPKIRFFDKLNPVWWLENADEPVPPAWYRPGDRG